MVWPAAVFLAVPAGYPAADHGAAPTEASITVVSPAGGEVWKPGSTATIRWRYHGKIGSHVRIELWKGDESHSVIAPRVPAGSGGSGSYAWKIPSDQAAANDYRVKVSSIANENYAGTSHRFSIPPPVGAGNEPDLVITKVSMSPVVASPGGQVTLSVTVKNAGPGNCPANGKLLVQTETETKTRTLPALNPNATRILTVSNVALPVDPGEKLRIAVEPPAGVTEVSTANNSREFEPSLGWPDLTVSKVAIFPASAAPGTPVKVSVTVKNVGAVACPAGGTVRLAAGSGAPGVKALPALSKNASKVIDFTGVPLPSSSGEKLVASVAPPAGVTESSSTNNSLSFEPNLRLPTLQLVSCSASGYWSMEGGKPALGDPVFFKGVLKNTSSYPVAGLPVHLLYQGQAIRTASVNLASKGTAKVEFDVVVLPLSLPAAQNTVTYTLAVNPPGAGGPPTDPANLTHDMTLEILKTGTVYVINRTADDSPLEGCTVSCSGGNYSQQLSTGEGSLAVFRNVPIGVPLKITSSKAGYLGYNGLNTFSGTLTGSSMQVKLYHTNLGSIAVTAKSQATGRELPGVGVEVVETGGRDLTLAGRPATFTLPSGTYTFRLSKRGFAPTTVTGTVQPAQVTAITASMSYTGLTTISGSVRDQNGYPLANQEVKVMKAVANTPVASGHTGTDGSYTFTCDNSGLFYLYLKATKGNASGQSEPECFWPGLSYRVDLVVAPPPPPPPASGWHEVRRKGCSRAIAASVPDTFFTQGWRVSTMLGLFGIRLKYRNAQSEIAEVRVDLLGGPAAVYNVQTEYNPGTVLGETGAAAAQSLCPTMSDTAADLLAFLIEESTPGITLSAEGGVGRTIACLDRLEIIDRNTGAVLWASDNGFDTLDSGYAWHGKTYATEGVNWSQAVIRVYLYLDGPDMLGPQNERCKMISWDLARSRLRYFNAPRNHPRFSAGE